MAGVAQQQPVHRSCRPSLASLPTTTASFISHIHRTPRIFELFSVGDLFSTIHVHATHRWSPRLFPHAPRARVAGLRFKAAHSNRFDEEKGLGGRWLWRTRYQKCEMKLGFTTRHSCIHAILRYAGSGRICGFKHGTAQSSTETFQWWACNSISGPLTPSLFPRQRSCSRSGPSPHL